MVTIVALVLGLWVLAAVLMAVLLSRAASREMPAPGAPGAVSVIRADHPSATRTVRNGQPLAG